MKFSEGDEKQCAERILEEIMEEKSPKFGKNYKLMDSKVEQTLNRKHD